MQVQPCPTALLILPEYSSQPPLARYLEQINSRQNHFPHWPLVQLHVFPHLYSGSSNSASSTHHPSCYRARVRLVRDTPTSSLPRPHGQQKQSQCLLFRCRLPAKTSCQFLQAVALDGKKKNQTEDGKEEIEKGREEETDRGKDLDSCYFRSICHLGQFPSPPLSTKLEG